MPYRSNHDLPKLDVPLLVLQGTEDRILPIESTGRRLPEVVNDIKLIEITGRPHKVCWTHSAEVNKALLEVLS